MTIIHDFNGPHQSGRYIMTCDNGSQVVYGDKEASALSALLARKVSPDVVIRELLAQAAQDDAQAARL